MERLVQAYAGGWSNQPGDWIAAVAGAVGPGYDAAGQMQPSLWCHHGGDDRDGDDPATMAAQFGDWRNQGVRGGFIMIVY